VGTRRPAIPAVPGESRVPSARLRRSDAAAFRYASRHATSQTIGLWPMCGFTRSCWRCQLRRPQAYSGSGTEPRGPAARRRPKASTLPELPWEPFRVSGGVPTPSRMAIQGTGSPGYGRDGIGVLPSAIKGRLSRRRRRKGSTRRADSARRSAVQALRIPTRSAPRLDRRRPRREQAGCQGRGQAPPFESFNLGSGVALDFRTYSLFCRARGRAGRRNSSHSRS
jgi:hypothetical protein